MNLIYSYKDVNYERERSFVRNRCTLRLPATDHRFVYISHHDNIIVLLFSLSQDRVHYIWIQKNKLLILNFDRNI